MKRRFIIGNGSTLTDESAAVNDYYSNTSSFTITAASDYLYIGSSLPFNSIYIEPYVANTNSSILSVQLWDGAEDWEEVAQVVDGTSYNGKTLGKAGKITIYPDKNYNWQRSDTVLSGGTENITGLGNIKIYDLFWMRLKFSANTSALKLKWISQLFCNDDDIGSEFPDLVRANVKKAFSEGKTDWKEQCYIASKVVIHDMMKKKILFDSNQILDTEDLILPCVQKTAQLIYTALGDDYIDQKNACEKEYVKRLDAAMVKLDFNMNAREDVEEQLPTIGRLYR